MHQHASKPGDLDTGDDPAEINRHGFVAECRRGAVEIADMPTSAAGKES